MLSEMAKQDIVYLNGLGKRQLTPDEIVTIHELAQDALEGAASSDGACAPRVAWAGGVAIFEPSCAAMAWLRTFAREWWIDKSLEIATCWVCANGNKSNSFFDAFASEPVARKAIEDWQKTLACTYAQLISATSFAVSGPHSLIAEDDEKTTEYDVAVEFSMRCPFAEAVHTAVAQGVGVSVDEVSKHPRRIIQSMLLRKIQYDVALAGGKAASLNNLNRGALARYNAYVKRIEDKLNGQG